MGGVLLEAVVVTRDRACSDVGFGADLGIAKIGQMGHFCAFADSGLFCFYKVANARTAFHVSTDAQARKWANGHAVFQAALRHQGMRLDRHVVAECRVGQDASSSNGAASTYFRFAQQLHARLDDGVLAGSDLWIDKHGLGQVDSHASVHECAALPFAKDAIHLGEVGAGIAAKDFAGIGDQVSQDRFASGAQAGDGVGKVKFAMHVVGSHLSESGPELFQSEAINRRINLVNFLLVTCELRFFDDGGDGSLRFAKHPAVTGGIGHHRGKDGCGGIGVAMRGDHPF